MKKKSLLLVIAVMLCAIGARAWTVQFTNPDNWEQVCVWAWDANNNNQNCTGGTWPGASMNKTGDVWTYTGNGTPTNILFNDSKGTNEGGYQTSDHSFVDGRIYDKSGVIGVIGEEGGGDVTYTTPIYISYDFSGSWAFDAITMTHKDGVYTATINNSRGQDGWITFGIGGKITNKWDETYRYGPSTDNTYITTGTAQNPLTKVGHCYKVPSGQYDVTVKKENNQWVAYFTTNGGGGGGGEEGDLCDNRRDGVTFTGTLPVIYITTEEIMIDRNLRDKDYRAGTYYLVDNSNPANNLGSEAEPLPLEIKARGNYTRTGFSKKPYKLKLGSKAAPLGLTKSKHFALLAHADEPHGFLNNTVGFWLGQQIGLPWTPREIPVEVVINGDYRGIYFLTESIRIDKDRINITELDDEVTDPALCSGGYLVEMDNYPSDGQIVVGSGENVRRITPDTPEVLSDIQRKFLTEQFKTMDDMVYANNDNLWRYIDLDDAARYYIVMEILDHWEAYHGSTYLFRDFGHGKKWHFSPLWDCGHAFDEENADHYFTTIGDRNYGNDWIKEMRENDKFMAKVKETWQWFWSGNRYQELQQMIEEFTAKISQAAARDWQRWNGVAMPNQYEDPLNNNALTNPSPVQDNTDLASKRSHVKKALDSKINFLVREWGNYENVSDEPARDTTEPAPLPSYVDPDFEPVYYTVYFQFEDENVNNMRIWIWNDDNDKFLGCDWDNRPTLTAKTNSAGVKYFEYTILGNDFDLTRNPQIIFSNDNYNSGSQTFVAGALYYVPKSGSFTVTENWNPNPIPVSGTLPVLTITVTDGSDIEDTVTKHVATATFTDSGFGDFADVALEIRGRGTTTWADFDKKPYKVEFDKKQVLINGISESKHYVLLPWAADTELSYLRNIAGHALSKQIGLDWTPGIEPVELVINGDYRGLYFIVENIRPATARVGVNDFSDALKGKIPMPEIWSDYIVELDNTAETPDFSFGTAGTDTEARFVLDSPEMSDLTRESDKEWIEESLRSLHTAMTYQPDDLDNRYHEVIDRESFVRFYLVQELMDDAASFTKSLYIHRSGVDGLWKFGPVWDFSGAFTHKGNKTHLLTDLVETDNHMMPLVAPFMRNLMVSNEVAIEFHKFAGTWSESEENGFPHWTWPYASSAPMRAEASAETSVNKMPLVLADIDAAAAKYKNALDADKAKWAANPGSDTFDDNVAKVKQYLNSNMDYLTERFASLTPSGVESIFDGTATDNLPVEYFDMTGRKVMNPGHGMYVRRQGATAVKVFIP